MKKPQKTTKKSKTKGVMVRLKHSTIDYLLSQKDEDADSAPAVARRIIEQKKLDDELKRLGG
ncbi:MAG TPA: hypothetical protein VJZ77_06580 [Blastocatellia bacterium]|nr:hypothetical protein [Blastocatellia bacterium]